MAVTPMITSVGSPVLRAASVQVLGTGFGRVSSCFLFETTLHTQTPVEFIVDRGDSLHFTCPANMPDGTYIVQLGTLDNIISQNTAAPFTLPDTSVPIPPDPPPPPNPIPDNTSTAYQTILARLRLELGDYTESFQSSVRGDGTARRFDLPEEVINTAGLIVSITDENGNATALSSPTDYTLNATEGILTLVDPLPDDSTLTVVGTHNQFFTDAELEMFILSAALKHTHNTEVVLPYRDANGFKQYPYALQTVDTLPPVEYHPVALLAAIEALEVIQTDASFDIDVTTAEGTSLPRTERFQNLGALIDRKSALYSHLCLMLGVGLDRVEVMTLRRVSRTTGRLVPVYVDREYDDVTSPPIRTYVPRNDGLTGPGVDMPDPYAYGGTGTGGYP